MQFEHIFKFTFIFMALWLTSLSNILVQIKIQLVVYSVVEEIDSYEDVVQI